MLFNFSSNVAEMNRKFEEYAKVLPVAAADALNKTMAQCRTLGDRKVREGYNIKSADLSKKVRLFKATRGSLVAILTLATYMSGGKARGSNLPLYNFGARQEANGVSFQIKKGGPRIFIANAMIVTLKNGHTGIFIRGTRTKSDMRVKFSPYLGKGVMRGQGYKSGRNGQINSFIEAFSPDELRKIFGGMRGEGITEYSLPMNELFSFISIEQMYSRAFPAMRKLADEKFPQIYEHEVLYRTGKIA